MKDDLAPLFRSSAELIDAIWQAFRDDRRDLQEAIAQLTEHEDPLVREEAIGLLLTKWRVISERRRAVEALPRDPDFGVRAAAAYGLAAVSTVATKQADVCLLLERLLTPSEMPNTKQASYEALLIMFGRRDFPSATRGIELERDVDWPWVRQLCGQCDSSDLCRKLVATAPGK
jgi:hypothetical protein